MRISQQAGRQIELWKKEEVWEVKGSQVLAYVFLLAQNDLISVKVESTYTCLVLIAEVMTLSMPIFTY